MNKIMKFENSTVEMQKIDGVWMFELYSVGMALGQIVTAKGKTYANKKRIDQNAENAEITSVLRNAKPYITESQVYDLMLEARTDKCRAFRKWLTNEVLPELNHTGTYTIPKQDKQLKIYEYFDKTYNGEPVLSTADASYMTGINRATIDWFMRTKLTIHFDYYLLRKSELAKFKAENPKVSKLTSGMYVITKSGFDEICKAYGIKLEPPKLFIEEKKTETPLPNTKKEYALVLSNSHIQEILGRIRKQMVAVDVLLTKFNRHNIEVSDMESLKKTLASIGMELGCEISGLAYEKLATTTEYKF